MNRSEYEELAEFVNHKKWPSRFDKIADRAERLIAKSVFRKQVKCFTIWANRLHYVKHTKQCKSKANEGCSSMREVSASSKVNEDRSSPCTLLRVIQREEMNELIDQVHVQSGHRRRNNNTETISKRFYWKTIVQDVGEYLKTCDVCQHQQDNVKAPAVLRPVAPPSLMMESILGWILSIEN
jgi:hypothetical protein